MVKIRWIAAFGIWLFLFFGLFVIDADAVKAESGQFLGLVEGFDERGQTFQSTGFGIYTGEKAFVISEAAVQPNASDAFYFTFGSEEDEMIELDGNNCVDGEELGFALWNLEHMDMAFLEEKMAFYPLEYPRQNQTATVFYLASNGDNYQIKSQNVRLERLEVVQDAICVLEADNLPYDIALYPAAVINQDGGCAGIVTKAGNIITLSGNEEEFYGQSYGGGQDYGEEDDAIRERDSIGEKDDTIRERDSIGEDGDDSDGLMKYLVFGGVGAGMLVVLLAVIVLQNRKKKTGAPTGQNNYVKATGPVWQGAAGAADPVEDYAGETSPIQGYGNVNFEERERVAQAKPVCFLMGVGGVMNGRKYPLTGKEITIGRYQTNVICYPENAPGVSRSHARLYMDGDRIMLMDCNSSGGTYLKRTVRLQTMHPVEVNIGDVFYIGEKRNGFEIRQ